MLLGRDYYRQFTDKREDPEEETEQEDSKEETEITNNKTQLCFNLKSVSPMKVFSSSRGFAITIEN